MGEPVHTLAEGQLVGARYRVEGVLGRGGMGVVYRAFDEQLNRPVAIKVLPGGADADAKLLSRFRNEALTLSALNHPNIVTVYEVGRIDDSPFIAMELVAGRTLSARLHDGPIPLREALDIGLQVARALVAAHDQGIVHKDIKPDNLMVRDDGYVKVLDFGIAVLRPQSPSAESMLARATRHDSTLVIAGTPAYMSPEQIAGTPADARSDLFSFGVTLCEALSGTNPFERVGVLDTLTNLTHAPAAAEPILAKLPKKLRAVLRRALQKNPDDRYQAASEFANELQTVAREVEGGNRSRIRWWQVAAASVALAAATVAVVQYRLVGQRRWVRETVLPQIATLMKEDQYAAAFPLVETAEHYLTGDPEVEQTVSAATRIASIRSSPPGATVAVKDYSDPAEDWLPLGTTPLERVRIPTGYLRVKLAKPGLIETTTAPQFGDVLDVDLERAAKAPPGMVPVTGGPRGDYIASLGWIDLNLPSFFMDRYEVTNRQYQVFVDKGGYTNPAYWTQPFVRDGRTLTFAEAMTILRDSTGRPGPATWEGGHYPEGKGDFPVSGVSWYEAAAYAAFAKEKLPVLAQFFKASPTHFDKYTVPLSNGSPTLARVGQYQALGPFGTYDTVGNAREWNWNTTGDGLRYSVGRLPGSYAPEVLPPFDRSPLNGFRCVINDGELPREALAPRPLLKRDFSNAEPASDEVFAAYRNMYAYDKTPLDAVVERVADGSEDWTLQKITFNTAYGHERMSAYLFLPKRVQPPFQTIVFFPSARVNQLRDSSNLGDLSFFDFVVKSGRAVIYPIYQYLYERSNGRPPNPGPTLKRDTVVAWSKDLGRSIDYLETRNDIDTTRLAYLGVSQGAANGVILAELENRFKAVVLLDGGFFQYKPVAGIDQVDFAPRLTKPVLMVNGRYDPTFPLETSQKPLFNMLGSPADEKRRVVFDTPHDVRLRRNELVREVLRWYDRYLGTVN